MHGHPWLDPCVLRWCMQLYPQPTRYLLSWPFQGPITYSLREGEDGCTLPVWTGGVVEWDRAQRGLGAIAYVYWAAQIQLLVWRADDPGAVNDWFMCDTSECLVVGSASKCVSIWQSWGAMVGIQRLSSGFALFDLCVFACYPTWGYIFLHNNFSTPVATAIYVLP